MRYDYRMRSKKNTSKHDEHKLPSKVALEARLQTGGGTHRESKEAANKRKGRLRGNEKKKYRSGDYDD